MVRWAKEQASAVEDPSGTKRGSIVPWARQCVLAEVRVHPECAQENLMLCDGGDASSRLSIPAAWVDAGAHRYKLF